MSIVELAQKLRELLAEPRDVSVDEADYRSIPDDQLLATLSHVADAARVLDGHRVFLAGEVARRSGPAQGYDGLAQRLGHRTPGELVRACTGATLRDAKTAILAGEALSGAMQPDGAHASEPVVSSTPWMLPVVAMVAAGQLGAEHTASIRRGLGDPGDGVRADELRAAVEAVCDEVRQHRVTSGQIPDADFLFRRARALRDELDASGVADRERHRISRRALRVVVQPDGMTRLTWLLDPESAGYVSDLYQRAMSPKLGGPRFVDAARQAEAEMVERDERTPEELASCTRSFRW